MWATAGELGLRGQQTQCELPQISETPRGPSVAELHLVCKPRLRGALHVSEVRKLNSRATQIPQPGSQN